MSRVVVSAAVAAVVVAVGVGVFGVPEVGVAAGPTARSAATCSQYSNQAAAQRAADTRDADGDGIYCEALPCPCSKASGGAPVRDRPQRERSRRSSCVKPRRIQNISFSATKYPNIKRHFHHAIARGWPRTLVLNRRGADARRDRLLEDYPTKRGFDRDEYPPAVGRGKGKGLTQGSRPRGWQADVEYVPSSENRSHGSTMGIKLRRFCDGTRFRYVFY
jgi:hypothetical protein